MLGHSQSSGVADFNCELCVLGNWRSICHEPSRSLHPSTDCLQGIYLFLSFLIQLPPSEISVSAFLPIGALGQGGGAIIQLGMVARDIEFISPQVSQTLHGIGIFAGLIMWSYALIWITFAVATMAARFPRIPFSMAWWGFTFPLGILRHLYLLTWRNICNMLRRTGERIEAAIL